MSLFSALTLTTCILCSSYLIEKNLKRIVCDNMEHRSIVLLFDPKESQIVNATKAFEYIKAKYNIDLAKEERLLKKLKYVAQHFYNAWQKAHRKQECFEKYNKDWLDGHLELAEYIAETPSTSTGRGRPQKQFDELSDRSKRRKTDEMFGGNVDTIEKALLATRKIAYRHGDSNMVNLIGHVLKNRESASKMFTTLKNTEGNALDELMDDVEQLDDDFALDENVENE